MEEENSQDQQKKAFGGYRPKTKRTEKEEIYDNMTSYRWGKKHETILQMTYNRVPAAEIAKTVGMNRMTIGTIIRSRPFRQRLLKLQAAVTDKVANKLAKDVVLSTAREYLNGNQMAAAKKLVELMGSDNEQIALKAAQDILDRTGMKAIEVIQNLTRNYTPEEIQNAQKTISEIETTIARLDNKDSNFLLVRQNKNVVEDAAVSSVTEKGSDVPTPQESSAT